MLYYFINYLFQIDSTSQPTPGYFWSSTLALSVRCWCCYSMFYWKTRRHMHRKCSTRITWHTSARLQSALLSSSRSGQRRYRSQILFRRSGRSYWTSSTIRWTIDGALCGWSESISIFVYCLPYEAYGNDTSGCICPCSTSTVRTDSNIMLVRTINIKFILDCSRHHSINLIYMWQKLLILLDD